MKKELIENFNNLANKVTVQCKKYSPEIFLGLGIVGTVASTILACKATTKVEKIMENKQKHVNAVHECLEDKTVAYDENDSKRDLTIIYAKTGLSLVKLYAPSIILGGLSIASIVSGHQILKRRNVALAAAYAAVDTGFKKYRKNVVERFGDEIDKELRYGIKATEIETKIKDKNGKEKTKKETVFEFTNGLDGISDYARFFDCTSAEHKKDPEYNLMFLRRQQDYANEVLKAKGHLFLNEVYDMLDIQRTKAGQIVGWIYDEKNPNGDNYVDFGIYNPTLSNHRFVNGYEYNILLDFNVDGVIYDKI